ncbi:MAG: hypothetical protein ACI9IA_002448, partial [Enterobacterales bacterium]
KNDILHIIPNLTYKLIQLVKVAIMNQVHHILLSKFI